MPAQGRDARRVRKLGRYELIAEIAKGGMGRVYLGRLRGVGGFERLLAIKLMHPHLAEEPEFVKMLFDEARLAAKLHHPNTVAITEVCNTDAGHYLVMEYVDGFTLSNFLKRTKDQPELRVRVALRLLLDAASGLEAAHTLTEHDGTPIGLVHRDVSPQNIMVGTDGVGRITDFGIAKAAARITSSRPGTLKGKMRYMAPEQARGMGVDRRADVFCLGILVWEAMTGEPLFLDPGGDAGTLLKVVQAPIPSPRAMNPHISPELEQVCMKALERDRDRRYQTARELYVDLDGAARRAGLLASTHEVADVINELFEKKIKKRRAAIRQHLEEINDGAISVSDVFSVPRLSMPSIPGQESQPSVSAVMASTASVQPPKSRTGKKLLVAVTVAATTALLLAGVAPLLFEDPEPEIVTDDTVAPAIDDGPELDSPVVAPNTIETSAIESGAIGSADDEPREEDDLQQPEPLDQETAPEPDEPASTESEQATETDETAEERRQRLLRARAAAQRRAEAREARGAPMAARMGPAAAPESGGLELEDNPYLGR